MVGGLRRIGGIRGVAGVRPDRPGAAAPGSSVSPAAAQPRQQRRRRRRPGRPVGRVDRIRGVVRVRSLTRVLGGSGLHRPSSASHAAPSAGPRDRRRRPDAVRGVGRIAHVVGIRDPGDLDVGRVVLRLLDIGGAGSGVGRCRTVGHRAVSGIGRIAGVRDVVGVGGLARVLDRIRDFVPALARARCVVRGIGRLVAGVLRVLGRGRVLDVGGRVLGGGRVFDLCGILDVSGILDVDRGRVRVRVLARRLDWEGLGDRGLMMIGSPM